MAPLLLPGDNNGAGQADQPTNDQAQHGKLQVTGPEDAYWLETIEGLYTGCP